MAAPTGPGRERGPQYDSQRPEQMRQLQTRVEARLFFTVAPQLLEHQQQIVVGVYTLLSDRLNGVQPQQDVVPQSPALHEAWRHQFARAVDAHSLPDQPNLQRDERLLNAFGDLDPQPYAARTAEVIADVFAALGITVATERIIESQQSQYRSLPGDYEQATNLNLLLIHAAQAIMGQESPLAAADILKVELPTEEGNPLTEDQRAYAQEKLEGALAQVAQVYDRSPETLLQDAAEEIAIRPENLALFADVTNILEQFSRVDDAMVDLELVQMHVTAGEALVEAAANNALAITEMNEAERTAVAKIAGVEDAATVASLSPREYIERHFFRDYLPDIVIEPRHLMISGVVLSLAEALDLKAQPLPTETPQSLVDAYRLFVDRTQSDIAAIPAAIDRYFGESDEGNTRSLEQRAARFKIPTEGRTREEISQDMQTMGNIVWLTLAATIGVNLPQDANGSQIRESVTSALNSISQNDIALDPETERVMRAIDQVAQTPNVTATYGGLFRREISASAFDSQGQPISQPQLEKLVRGWGSRRRRRAIRHQGFIN